MRTDKNQALKLSYYSFFVLVILHIAGSFLPHLRVWGFNQLAWWFPFSPLVLGLVIVGSALLIYKLKLEGTSESGNSDKSYFIFSLLSLIIFGLMFYLLRGRTHFLGDGTQLIPILIDENLAVKAKNIGEQWLHIQLFKILSGEPEARALLSYQLISYFSGILSVGSILIFAYRIFKDNLRRIIFSLGIISGGYSLLFFGYVENYSIFAFLIILFVLLGLTGYNSLKCKLFMVGIVVLATWMHIFGLLLLPALVYLFISDLSAFKKYWTHNRQLRYIGSFFMLAGMFLVIYWYAQKDIVFRFSLLPPFNDKFIVEGYTLFSMKHLLDLLNLLIMTLPALFVMLILFFKTNLRKKLKRPITPFLILSAFGFIVTTFIFDPTLSMPVDWDIFSLFTIPLTVFIYFTILKSSLPRRTTIGLLMVLIGFTFLIPRVIIQTNAPIAIKHAFNYCDLDIKRNIKTSRSVNDYIEAHNLEQKYEASLKHINQLYPELLLNENGMALKHKKRFREALAYFQRALEEHPGFSGAYYNIANCTFEMGQYQKANEFAMIAHGISPDNVNILNLLANIALFEKDYERAFEYIKLSFERDKNNIYTMITLAGIYHNQGDKANYLKTMLRIVDHPEADANPFFYLGDFYLQNGQNEKAKELFQHALTKQPDSAMVEQIYKIFPDLKN